MMPSIFKHLGLIDYSNIPTDYVYIGTLPNALSSPNREIVSDIFIGKGLFIVRKEGRLANGKRNSITQFEMPLDALSWVLESIETMFERKPSLGGLAKDIQHTDKAFDGENIELRYGVSVAGEGIGGYTVTNFSRDCHILPGEAAQTFSFALTIWQDHARAIFKDIIKRQLAGEFA
ncbi:hypothetical protein [Rheinheimera pleomorphica]|uniref:hypothetical protein n=1 Tax=Rheinheimera pleomorphica TaxID=2703963 RepID=UPI00141F856A|nr:hypothetical protein [Rheinheimera pleomorphica]